METFAKETVPISLEEEMRRSYLDYAMSVIVGRALPDVRDGLKPVHRRVLYAMHEANNVWNRPYVKCARIVGRGHGQVPPPWRHRDLRHPRPYGAGFTLRYPLIDGQGNFGSIDGDNAAAMRYTECRLARIAGELLSDIGQETVDFQPNYDGKEQEPTVLPEPDPEPSRQRLHRHRRGDGDQHSAAQPWGSRRRLPGAAAEPRHLPSMT